jgi:hypothetical protein
VIKSRKIYAVTPMGGEKRNAYISFVGRPEGKRPFGRESIWGV